jgi:TRAP-type C4-dicarboxylate transport system substrate-binding protein
MCSWTGVRCSRHTGNVQLSCCQAEEAQFYRRSFSRAVYQRPHGCGNGKITVFDSRKKDKEKRMKKITALALGMSLILGFTGLLFATGRQEKESAEPDKVYELKIGHLSAVGGLEDLAVKRIAEVAKEKSNGRLILNIFPASQLGNFVSQMESIAMGTQDLVWGAYGWLGNFVKDYQIMIMPYAFKSQQHMFNFMDSELGQDLEKELESMGYILLTKRAYQLSKCVISRKPVRTAEDLVGLKIRVPEWPVYMAGWKAMGTNTVVVSWGELYLALAQGVADAMTSGFEFIYPGKFHEVAPYITRTHHLFGARGAILGTKTKERLPDDLMNILEEAALAGEKHYLELLHAAKVDHEKKLLDEGAEIIEIDDAPLREKVKEIVPQLEAEGYWSKGLFDKIQNIKAD